MSVVMRRTKTRLVRVNKGNLEELVAWLPAGMPLHQGSVVSVGLDPLESPPVPNWVVVETYETKRRDRDKLKASVIRHV